MLMAVFVFVIVMECETGSSASAMVPMLITSAIPARAL